MSPRTPKIPLPHQISTPMNMGGTPAVLHPPDDSHQVRNAAYPSVRIWYDPEHQGFNKHISSAATQNSFNNIML